MRQAKIIVDQSIAGILTENEEACISLQPPATEYYAFHDF